LAGRRRPPSGKQGGRLGAGKVFDISIVAPESKIFHHGGTEDTKGKRCKPQAPRTRRKEGGGLWIIRPCFRPSVVRVVRGHGGCEVRKAVAWHGAMATQALELHPSIQPS
jgi:hypothetical protein